MHMADALLSPAVGGGFWAGALAFTGYAARQIRSDVSERLIPLMGVLGAFVFAAQMINFTIPGTGSSGHLGGGMLLAILLGPHAAFIVMSSVLTVQALFFADGGLLALGSNIWNIGILPCYVAYPLVFKVIAKGDPSRKRMMFSSLLSSVVALQLGAFSVVLQTSLSGVAELPFKSFLLLMQPIHLAIGIVEGAVTAAVVNYIRTIQPDILRENHGTAKSLSYKKLLIPLIIISMLTGGMLSWFASSNPDGLEWAIEKTTGSADLPEKNSGFFEAAKKVQEKTALLPDYSIPGNNEHGSSRRDASVSGLLGSLIVFSVLLTAGIVFRYTGKRKS